MVSQNQQQPATPSRGTLDLYQQITKIPFTETTVEASVSETPRADAGFVDLVIWAVLITSLAIGFWA